jgi:hypothetical protein
LLCTREVREANFKGNTVSPRSFEEVNPESFGKLKINSSKGSG